MADVKKESDSSIETKITELSLGQGFKAMVIHNKGVYQEGSMPYCLKPTITTSYELKGKTRQITADVDFMFWQLVDSKGPVSNAISTLGLINNEREFPNEEFHYLTQLALGLMTVSKDRDRVYIAAPVTYSCSGTDAVSEIAQLYAARMIEDNPVRMDVWRASIAKAVPMAYDPATSIGRKRLDEDAIVRVWAGKDPAITDLYKEIRPGVIPQKLTMIP